MIILHAHDLTVTTEGCIIDQRQFETAMPQKRFSGDTFPTSVHISKIILPLNSVNYSTSETVEEMNLWNRKLRICIIYLLTYLLTYLPQLYSTVLPSSASFLRFHGKYRGVKFLEPRNTYRACPRGDGQAELT